MRNCSSCKHAEWELTPSGRISRLYAGKCNYPIEAVKLPSCCGQNVTPHKGSIWPDFGEDCPCWEDKESGESAEVEDGSV